MRQPFNLEKAISGQPVITREGSIAKFIAYVPEARANGQVLFLINGVVFAHSSDGRYNPIAGESMLDLFMHEKPKTVVWINVFVGGAVTSHDSEAEADRFASEVWPSPRKGGCAYPLEIAP